MKNLLLLMILLGTSFIYSQTSSNEKLDIQGGYFIGNNEVSKKEFKQTLLSNPKAYKQFKNGKTIQVTGIIISVASAGYLGASIGSGNIETEGYIGGGLGLLGGLLAIIGGKSMMNKSIDTYNQSIETISFNFGVSNNGIALNINF